MADDDGEDNGMDGDGGDEGDEDSNGDDEGDEDDDRGDGGENGENGDNIDVGNDGGYGDGLTNNGHGINTNSTSEVLGSIHPPYVCIIKILLQMFSVFQHLRIGNCF